MYQPQAFFHADRTYHLLGRFLPSTWWNLWILELQFFNTPLLSVWFWRLKNQILLWEGTEAPRNFSLSLVLLCTLTLKIKERRNICILTSSLATHWHDHSVRHCSWHQLNRDATGKIQLGWWQLLYPTQWVYWPLPAVGPVSFCCLGNYNAV